MNMTNDLQLKGKVLITGNIVVRTGLAIGGSKTALNIGGIDSPVIRDAKGVPYIPGSSLKGKMRSLLETSKYPLRNEYDSDGKGYFDEKMVIHRFIKKENDKVIIEKIDDITKIFGDPDVNEPERGIFRDAWLDVEHFEKNKHELFKNLELEYTEDKIENAIDRITAKANPRHLERVPPGVQFRFEIILDLYSGEDKELLKTLFTGLKLLEDDYLGASGTRGSGKVSFENIKLNYRPVEFYKSSQAEIALTDTSFNVRDINNIQWFEDVFNKINI